MDKGLLSFGSKEENKTAFKCYHLSKSVHRLLRLDEQAELEMSQSSMSSKLINPTRL